MIPVLGDGTLLVAESLDILRHLEERYPDHPLLPPGSGRAVAEHWMAQADHVPLEPLHAALASPRMLDVERRQVPKMLARMAQRAQANPELAELYADKMAAFKARTSVYDAPMSRVEALEKVDAELASLDDVLRSSRWVAGDDYTLADVLWTVVLARFCFIGLRERVESNARPHLVRYLRALLARPSFRRADVWDQLTIGRVLPLAWQVVFGGSRKAMPWPAPTA